MTNYALEKTHLIKIQKYFLERANLKFTDIIYVCIKKYYITKVQKIFPYVSFYTHINSSVVCYGKSVNLSIIQAAPFEIKLWVL